MQGSFMYPCSSRKFLTVLFQLFDLCITLSLWHVLLFLIFLMAQTLLNLGNTYGDLYRQLEARVTNQNNEARKEMRELQNSCIKVVLFTCPSDMLVPVSFSVLLLVRPS